MTAEGVAKLDVPLRDLPAAVEVVPSDVLRDRAVVRTSQMLESVSGVQAESNYGGNGATFFNVRGFTTSNGLRDGFRNYGYIAFRDVQNIDRIEVLKGPAGALYGGLGAIGGQINTVSKRPMTESFGELSLQAGSYGQVRPTVDVNVGSEQGMSFRINGAYDQNDTFRDNAGYDLWTLAPALMWRGESSTFTLLTEFNHLERDGFDFGVPNLPDYRLYSRTRYFGLYNGTYSDLDGDFGDNDTRAATAIFEHGLGADWKLRIAAHYSHARQRSQQTFPDNYLYAGGDTLHFTTYIGADEWSTDRAGQVELRGTADLGGMKHRVLAGVELSYTRHGYNESTLSGFDVDMFDPSVVNPRDPIIPSSGDEHNGIGKDLGIYVQDLIDLAPAWKLLVGLRWDRFHNEAESTGSSTTASQSALSSQFGVVYALDDSTALFGRWGRSYLPNVSHSVTQVVYDAEKGTQIEFGVKRDLLGKRLGGSLAVYDLRRSNILVPDPSDPVNVILQGQQKSRGIEAALRGELATGWSWTATYAYTNARVTRDTTVPVGDHLSNVPRHSGSLWTTYAFSGGFGVAGGVYAAGKREANLPNTYRLPGYARVDVMAYYEHRAWRAQINVGNLLDKRYYTGGEAGVFNYTLDPSTPRNALLTMSYHY